MRPIYQSAQQAGRGVHGHAGLWFDKFCDRWRRDGGHWTMKTPQGANGGPNPKVEWLRTLTGSNIGDPEQLRDAQNRLARLVQGRSGAFQVFLAEERFITGMGRSHPVENGFAFHPTLGTPFLPGSSVKGLVRAWATSKSAPDLERLLGKPGEDGHAGAICFLDAIPVAPVSLEVDVLTPHAANWSPDKPPGDWRSPVPVPFLTMAAGAHFLFGVVPCPSRVGKDPKAAVETVMGWLAEALEWEGAGAKTAVGYGRFAADDAATMKLREQLLREEALRSPAARWRLEVEALTEGALLTVIPDHLDKKPLVDPVDRAAFVAAVRELRSSWLDLWGRGKKADHRTNMGPDKLKLRARLIRAEPGG